MYMSSKGLEFREMLTVQILSNHLFSLICRQWEELYLLMDSAGQ